MITPELLKGACRYWRGKGEEPRYWDDFETLIGSAKNGYYDRDYIRRHLQYLIRNHYNGDGEDVEKAVENFWTSLKMEPK